MRITGGTSKGRNLKVPAGSRVRPTSDKVKQALFNILGEKVNKSAFLDLFAGAGGIGIEALSRGAERVVFVDDARDSLHVIRKNIELIGFSKRAAIVGAKAEKYLKKVSERFDIVFLDPPYTHEQEPVLNLIAESGILEPDAIVVAEHFKKQPSPKQAGALMLSREAVYGDTVLAFYQFRGQGSEVRSQENTTDAV
jgi:16S rRNA (guanine966-N2)-methyltransferase